MSRFFEPNNHPCSSQRSCLKSMTKDTVSMDITTCECATIVYKYICDLLNAPLNEIYLYEISSLYFYFYSTIGDYIKPTIFLNSYGLTWRNLVEYTQFPDQENLEIRDKVEKDKLNSSFYYSMNGTWKDKKIMEIKNLVIWHFFLSANSDFLESFENLPY